MSEKITHTENCVGLLSKGANAKSTKGVLRVIVNDLIVLNNTFLRIRAIILILSFICILLPIILLKHLLFPWGNPMDLVDQGRSDRWSNCIVSYNTEKSITISSCPLCGQELLILWSYFERRIGTTILRKLSPSFGPILYITNSKIIRALDNYSYYIYGSSRIFVG